VSAPILTTKLYFPPARTSLVSRPRLVEKLDRGLKGTLTLISAPAGYGKTTLMSEWRTSVGRDFPLAWLSLDVNDNDFVRFMNYLAFALTTLDPVLAINTLPLVQSPQHPPISEILTTLINDISEFDQQFVFALDDYHVITDPAIHGAVTYLTDHLPPQMHLVILTRADPPLPLSRLRSRGQLVEIRSEELRFTIPEASAFFSQVMGIELSPAAITALESRSEGWIAALQLVALSIQGRTAESLAGFITDFAGTHHYIADYLVEEVLNRQSDIVREFLLCTSILDQLTGSLCDALLDRGDGQNMLEILERSNLFLTGLDDERRWYRYHHLFADLLRSHLRREHPQRWIDLHRRAAQWCEQHDMVEESVQYALTTEDYEMAGNLIEKVSGDMVSRERISLMMRWVKSLPKEVLYSRPRLCIYYAWTLSFGGYLDEADNLIRYVEEAFEEYKALGEKTIFHNRLANLKNVPSQDGRELPFEDRLSIVLNLQHASIERFRNLEMAKTYCGLALKHLPANDIDNRTTALFFLGHIQLLNGETLLAHQTLQESVRLTLLTQESSINLSAVNYLGQAMILQGKLHQAMELFTQAARLMVSQPKSHLLGIELIRMGDVYREWNELDKASQNIQEGLHLAESIGDFVFLRDGYIAKSRLEQSLGNLESAGIYLQKAERIARNTETAHGITPIKALQVSLWIGMGDIQSAEQWIKDAGLDIENYATHDSPHFLDEYSLITLARLHIARGHLGEARRLLDQLQTFAASAGRQGRVIEILILQALAHYAGGEKVRAVEALTKALVLAEPEGYVRLFVEQGAKMEELLELVGKSKGVGALASYVYKLLGTFPDRQAKPLASLQQPLIEPLSQRELEILQLVAAGMSNREVADQLVLATGTVKKHLNNIFGKLDVQNRTQCVARARELHLLS
jgi:LuxR family maltose regulon positive regulatory protein